MPKHFVEFLCREREVRVSDSPQCLDDVEGGPKSCCARLAIFFHLFPWSTAIDIPVAMLGEHHHGPQALPEISCGEVIGDIFQRLVTGF